MLGIEIVLNCKLGVVVVSCCCSCCGNETAPLVVLKNSCKLNTTELVLFVNEVIFTLAMFNLNKNEKKICCLNPPQKLKFQLPSAGLTTGEPTS
jgi:hypothetical protein